jgi:hypothetical protein
VPSAAGFSFCQQSSYPWPPRCTAWPCVGFCRCVMISYCPLGVRNRHEGADVAKTGRYADLDATLSRQTSLQGLNRKRTSGQGFMTRCMIPFNLPAAAIESGTYAKIFVDNAGGYVAHDFFFKRTLSCVGWTLDSYFHFCALPMNVSDGLGDLKLYRHSRNTIPSPVQQVYEVH